MAPPQRLDAHRLMEMIEMQNRPTAPQRREERPRQAARLKTRSNRGKTSTTRDERRAALVAAMIGGNVVSFADGLARLRARLDSALLDENPDQQAEARAWGDR